MDWNLARDFIAQSTKREIKVRAPTQRVRALIYALFLGIIIGLLGWVNPSCVKERLNWYMTMRPYMIANVRPYVLPAEAERALKPQARFRECAKDCPEMVVIPKGEFTMGSPATKEAHYDNESPQHKVMIARPFAVSKFDVTFADWDACVSVGGCPQVGDSGFGRDTKPVTNVTWDDAQQYVA